MRLIDMHCDTISHLMRETSISLKENALSVDLHKMKEAGSMAQFFACFIYKEQFPGENGYEDAYGYALKMIARGKAAFSEISDGLEMVRNCEELARCCKEGKIGAFLTIEEGGILGGRLERLEELYRLGIRLITLTWNYENCIGYPNSRDREVMQKGLKPFGVEVIERMNELGMLIDVSHLSDGGFWDVIKRSRKPVVASHSNARSLCAHRRNLTDDMIRALAQNGGVTGLNLYPFFLHESGKATIEHMAEHIAHMYQVGGEDVVVIGTDFDGYDDGESEIMHMGQMGFVYQAIKKRGFTERQMEKFWNGNALRVLRETLI